MEWVEGVGAFAAGLVPGVLLVWRLLGRVGRLKRVVNETTEAVQAVSALFERATGSEEFVRARKEVDEALEAFADELDRWGQKDVAKRLRNAILPGPVNQAVVKASLKKKFPILQTKIQ